MRTSARWRSNLALGAWLALDGSRILRSVSLTVEGSLSALLGASLLIASVYAFTRSAPITEEGRIDRRVFVLAAAAVPWLWWWIPGLDGGTSVTGLAVRALSVAGILASTVSLGHNFSVLPQARHLACRGVYRVLRHPLYASYLLFDLSFFLDRPNAWAIALWTLEAVMLGIRVNIEEDCLLTTRLHYSGYRRAVRWRLLPGVF